MGRTGVVTIRDVARECGFSASTVSIVLNGAPLSRYIPAETKGKIETAAKRTGVILSFLRGIVRMDINTDDGIRIPPSEPAHSLARRESTRLRPTHAPRNFDDRFPGHESSARAP